MIYNGANIKGSFEEFFEEYSKIAVCSPTPSSSQMVVEGDDSELAKKINEFEKKRKELRARGERNPFYKTPDFYDKSPFLSTASELLTALKEGLIEKLVIITQFTGEKDDFVRNKESVFKKTFQKFPQVEICVHQVKRVPNPEKGMNEYQRFKPYRHEVITKMPYNFDIYLEDNPQIIMECQKVLPPGKVGIYAAPDYKSLHKVPNLTLVKTTISDLKFSDFVYQEKPKDQPSSQMQKPENSERERERANIYLKTTLPLSILPRWSNDNFIKFWNLLLD